MTSSDNQNPQHVPNQRTYWCFISYRHADDKQEGRHWASWLHHTLETYEVPNELVGRKNDRGDIIPSRIYPVFRDEEELPADADLTSPIRIALQRSLTMVVLCSPRAVSSRYVAEEIKYFKTTGKADRVMAALLDGEPNVSRDASKCTKGLTAADECFPEPLQHQVRENGAIDYSTHEEPFAPDFRLANGSEGWTSAGAYRQHLQTLKSLKKHEIEKRVNLYQKRLHSGVLRIIAGILGVPYGELTKRDKAYQLAQAQHRSKILRRWLFLVLALTILALVGGIFGWIKRAEAIKQERRAATALERTSKTLSNSDLKEGIDSVHEDDTQRALMYFDRALRVNPANLTARSNLLSLLFNRNWALPLWSQNSNRQMESSTFGAKHSFPHSYKDAAFSPNGSQIALALAKGEIQIVNSDTGAKQNEPILLGHDIDKIAYTPSGRRLLSLGCKSGLLTSHDPENISQNLPRIQLPEPDHWCDWVFGNYGKILATWEYKKSTIRLYDSESLQSLDSIQLFDTEGINKLIMSEDGTILVAISKEGVKCIDLSTKPAVQAWITKSNDIYNVSISPDNRFLVFNDKGAPVVYDLKINAETKNYYQGLERGLFVSFNPNNACLAEITSDRRVRIIYNTGSGRHGALLGREGDVARIKFSPDGQFLSAISENGTVHIYDFLQNLEPLIEPIILDSFPMILFSPNMNKVLTQSDDSTAVWDIRKGSIIADEVGVSFGDFVVGIHPIHNTNEAFIATPGNKVQLFNVLTKETLGLKISHDGFVVVRPGMKMSFMMARPPLWSPDHKWVLTQRNGHIIPINPYSGIPLRAPIPREGNSVPLISPDSRLALIPDGINKLLVCPVDSSSSTQTVTINLQSTGVLAFAFSPDSSHIYVATLKSINVYSATDGKYKMGWTASHGLGSQLLTHPATLMLVSIAGNTVRLYDTLYNRESHSHFTHTSSIDLALFSGNGRRLYITSGDDSAQILDLESMQAIGFPMHHESPVAFMSLSSSGSTLLCLTSEGKVHFWNAYTGQQMLSSFATTQEINYIYLNDRNHKLLLSGSTSLTHLDLSYELDMKSFDYQQISPWIKALSRKRLNDYNLLVRHEGWKHQLIKNRNLRSDKITAWFFSDRKGRTISPLSSTRVEDWKAEKMEFPDFDDLMQLRGLDFGSPAVISRLGATMINRKPFGSKIDESKAYSEIMRNTGFGLIKYLSRNHPVDPYIQSLLKNIEATETVSLTDTTNSAEGVNFKANREPTGVPVPGKPGYIFNPYTKNMIDVRGIPSGTLVRDPEDLNPSHMFRTP